MAVYDLRGLTDDFVVHYGGDEQRIDAFTFGNSLIAVGNALQAINKEMNPGFSLEISVVALGGGSFRPRLRTKARRLASLLIGDIRGGLVGAFCLFLVDRMLGGDPEPQIVINADNVEIHYHEGDVIILPRDAYDAYGRSKLSKEVDRALRQAFEALEEDEAVKSFGVSRSPEETADMPVLIDRRQFPHIARPAAAPIAGQRDQMFERAELFIVRAIFEDSARRWQFVWQGNRISAPLLDEDYRRRIVRGEVSITHGDQLVADLRVLQTADPSGVWINDAYEVVKVHDKVPRPEQRDLLS